ncbi:MAG: zinc ribbon domain-containing protein [Treponema sp.]|nr:zinc ribbon domain-containing protein [Treponema sp.]
MANCSKCGNPVKAGEKFCASCGTPVKQAAAVKSGTAAKSPAATAVGGASISKIASIAVTAACAVTVIFFFFSFFGVSFTGTNSYLTSYLASSLDELGSNVNGMEAAVGSDGTEGGYPALVLIWLLAIAMLVALYVPIIRQKLESFQLPVINVPVIGGLSIFGYLAIIVGLIGLIVLIATYASVMGSFRRGMGGSAAALSMLGGLGIKFGTGIGFKMTVFAQLILLGIPFADKYFLSKRG